MLSTFGRDRVARPFGTAALTFHRDALDVADADKCPQDSVDRRVLDREPEPESVVVEDLLDPVAVQRLLGEQPEH